MNNNLFASGGNTQTHLDLVGDAGHIGLHAFTDAEIQALEYEDAIECGHRFTGLSGHRHDHLAFLGRVSSSLPFSPTHTLQKRQAFDKVVLERCGHMQDDQRQQAEVQRLVHPSKQLAERLVLADQIR